VRKLEEEAEAVWDIVIAPEILIGWTEDEDETARTSMQKRERRHCLVKSIQRNEPDLWQRLTLSGIQVDCRRPRAILTNLSYFLPITTFNRRPLLIAMNVWPYFSNFVSRLVDTFFPRNR
jgi:hypothetical protein